MQENLMSFHSPSRKNMFQLWQRISGGQLDKYFSMNLYEKFD